MHTSFEKIDKPLPPEGSIYMMGPDGDPVWYRPRTRREAGTLWTLIVLGTFTALPLVVALVFILT